MKITFSRETMTDGYSADRKHKQTTNFSITVTGLPHDPQEISAAARNICNIASVCERAPGTPDDVIDCMGTIQQLATEILENVTE